MLKLQTVFKGLILSLTLVLSIMVGHFISINYLQPQEIVVAPVEERHIQLPSGAFIIGDTAYAQIYDSIACVDSRAFWEKTKHFKYFKVKRVVIYLNSPGGILSDAFGIIDDIIELKNQGIVVEVEIRGMALSAAIPILAVCSYRTAGENTVFLVHNPKMVVSTSSNRLALMMITKKYIDFLEDHTYLRAETWKLKMNAELWFGVEEALEWGLIDEILEEKEPVQIQNHLDSLENAMDEVLETLEEKEM